jgi:hypothetical protein
LKPAVNEAHDSPSPLQTSGVVRKRTNALSKVTFFLPLLAYVVIYFVDRSQFHPSGDGYYSWIFARSLAFDGDVDFKNDYALCGDPMGVGVDRGTGHLDNPFYAGPAAFWVPPLLVLRALFTLFVGAEGAARASCGGWMTALAILTGPLCAALTVWLAFKAARLLVPESVAAVTALVFAFSSPLFPYATSVAHYSHVYLAFSVAVLTYVSIRIALVGEQPRDALWLALAIAVSALNRLPAMLYVIVPLAALAPGVIRRRTVSRSVIAIALGTAVGIGLTGLLYKYLYGKWVAVPQGPVYVHLTHAHPLLVLFGVHGGFFFWMPLAWLIVPGFALAARQSRIRLVTVACIAASVVETLVSSSSLDWSAHWTLGARRLLPLMPFVVVFSAVAADPIALYLRKRVSERARYIGAAVVIALVLVNNIPAATIVRGDVEFSQRELYGAWSPFRPVWKALDDAGIDVALLPAELYFTARYGLPMRSYREAITPRYRRGHRDLLFFPNAEIDLREAWAANLIWGAAWSRRGAEVTEKEAHVVFAAEWPYATHVKLLVSSPINARLDMAIGGAFGARQAVGSAIVTAGGEPMWVELELPPKSFDSGIDEWIFRTEGGTVLLSNIEILDRQPLTPYGAAPAATAARLAESDARRSPSGS